MSISKVVDFEMKFIHRHIACFFILFLFSETVGLSAESLPEPILLSVSQDSITINEMYQYITDQNGTLRLNEATRDDAKLDWQEGKRSPLFLGSTGDFIWVRFRIKSSHSTRSDWILNVEWPFFDVIEMYVHDPATGQWTEHKHLTVKSIESSITIPADLPYAFEFSCPENTFRTIYMRLHASGKMLLPIHIWQKNSYRRMALHRNIVLGIFFGILIAMCGYNMSLFFFTGDNSYAYYSVYVISIILYTLGMTGAGATYVWFDSTWIKSHSYGVFSSFGFLMATLFIRRFLSLPDIGGWMLHLSNAVAIYWVLLIILFVVQNDRWLIGFEDLGAIISCIAGLVITIFLWMRGNISAKYLTIAWTLLIISTFILMLGLIGIIDFLPLVQHSQNIGFVLEVMLLSLALAERISRERAEKEAAQKLSFELHLQASEAREREMKAQAKTLEVERAAKEELSQKVELKTKELRDTLSALEAANKELGLLSRTDGLTQLFNRRHFDEMLEIEFKRAVRLSLPLSVILGDIDHFKAINDTYGHQIGDECLQVVASTWRSQMVRAGDLVARYGGEEFVAILPGTDANATLVIAERIRHSIEAIRLIRNGQRILLTISLGVSSILLHRKDNAVSLLERADKAMYYAKTQGRNRVIILKDSEINSSDKGTNT